jgi:outer membrane protein OmpA-like peptidoglycan-associated protein/tetratricopeptide (TPR) repeat protein
VPFIIEYYTIMKVIQNSLLIICSFCALTARGQKIDHANELYKNGFYAAAIPAYESFLKRQNNPIATSRLADCYRILNKADKAASTYAKMVADSTAQAKDIFNYGDVLMLLGKYDSAKMYFQKYIELNPNDARGLQSLKASEDAPTIKPFFTDIKLEPFSQNTEADENAPFFFKNKLLFATDRNSGFNVLKEKNNTTGRDYITIWAADKISDSTYAKPSSFSTKLNNVNENTGSVSFTADNKEMFFCRNSDMPDKGNSFNMQIFSAESKDGEKWGNIEKMPFCSNELNYFYPSVSPDGKSLFFVSDKGGGSGGLDIYISNRTKKGWSKPENLGTNVNTTAHEGFPYAAADGKLYFCSKGHIGFGGFDIFVTNKDSIGQWATPINLGTPINSAYDDISLSFADAAHGAFASPRSGRGDDIFFFSLPLKDSVQLASVNGSEDSKFVRDSNFTANTAYLDSLASSLNRKLNLRKGKTFKLESIVFDPETALIKPSVRDELDKLADVLSMHRKMIFEIGFHTDMSEEKQEDGKPISKKLAQERAEAIVNHLIEKGINKKRIVAKGHANTQKRGAELKIKDLK